MPNPNVTERARMSYIRRRLIAAGFTDLPRGAANYPTLIQLYAEWKATRRVPVLPAPETTYYEPTPPPTRPFPHPMYEVVNGVLITYSF